MNNAPEFEIWLATEQERRRQRAADLLQLLTTHYADSRDYAAALKWARQLLALTPWQEEAHRQVMTLLARRGQFSAALAQYQNCRRALRAELSVEPSTETQTLQRRILNARSAPPLRFPQFPTPFVGRRDDLAQIARLLAKPACRLLTLLGLGGSGKTRLAIEAAKAQRHAFLDGVVFISLAAIDSGSAFYAALAEALRLPLHPAEDPQRQLIEFLQDREILLALDNFEYLLDEAPFLAKILRAAPAVKLLLTSRRPLNLRWETRFVVRGLPYQSADLAADSVTLFTQNAQRVKLDFQPSARNRPDIVKLCQQVEGHPLALELASAWVGQLKCREISAKIAKNLDILATTMPDVSPRQQNIQAVIDYSQQLLSAKTQPLLPKLSVFRGGFSAAAAQKICKASRLALAELEDKFLLRRHPSGRCEMHELVRQFARRQLRQSAKAEAQLKQARARFYADFLRQRERAAASIQPAREIGEEWGNIAASWEWALQTKDAAFIAAAAAPVSDFLALRGRIKEGTAMMTNAINALADKSDNNAKLARGRAQTQRGVLISHFGELPEALRAFDKSLLLFETLQSDADTALALVEKGHALQDLGRYAQAELFCARGMELYKKLNCQRGVALAHKMLGHTYYHSKRWAKARASYLESARLFEELADKQQLSAMRINLGNIAFELEDYAEAESNYRQSLELKIALGDQRGIATAWHNLGEVAFKLKDYQKAGEFLQQSFAIAERINARPIAATSLNLTGDIALARNDFSAAREAYFQSLTISAAGRSAPVTTAEALNRLGELAKKQGNPAEAEDYFRRARGLLGKADESHSG